MADVESILKPLPVPDSVKADAWDAYHGASSLDDLTGRLNKLPLTDAVKADIWDAKNSEAHFSTTVTADAPKSFLQKTVHFLANNPVTDAVAGAGSGVVSTVMHGGDLIRRGEIGIAHALGVHPDKIPAGVRDFFGLDRVIDRPEVQQAMTPPNSFFGKAGKFVEQGAEYLAPMGVVADLAKGAPLVARLAADALVSGGIAGVQTGGDPTAMAETALTTGALGAAGAAVPPVAKYVGTPILQGIIDNAPRPLSAGAEAMAQRFNVPLTRGMSGGSRTVQSAEKLLGHTVAPDIYEPILESAQQGVTQGAKKLSGDFATDRYTAGDYIGKRMLGTAEDLTNASQKEYSNLARLEADPANVQTVQTGTRTVRGVDPVTGQPVRQVVPVQEAIGLPVDMRQAKQDLEPLVDVISRRMTPAQRRADPGLAAVKNILSRPDYLSASTAEADLSYLKEILRSNAHPQAKRMAAKAIDAIEQNVQDAVSKAGPDALQSLLTARKTWQTRSEILDTLKGLSNDESGKTGQVLLANKLLQPADASFPTLQKVLGVAPDAAEDLGKAYLTERVFKKVAGQGAEFTNPKEAANLWNHIGPRTKAALYTPEQITDINNFLELAKRVAENPNPSGTGPLNALMKLGVFVTHPVQGASAFVLGRNVAKLLYEPGGVTTLKQALAGFGSGPPSRSMLAVKALLADSEASQAR